MKNKTIIYSLIALVLILTTIGIVSTGQRPEVYDFLGLITFTFLLGVGIYMLKKPKKTPEWIWHILILIGVLGLIIDGSIILKEFVLKWVLTN